MTDSSDFPTDSAARDLKPGSSSSQTASRGFRALAAVLVLALVTRVAYAYSKSLVLDEFHSYYHATFGSWESFMKGLLQDNHPPLSFLIIGVAKSALGRAEWALRSPAIVFGMLEIAVVASMAGSLVRRVDRSRRRINWSPMNVPVWGAAMLAVSTLHFDYGTQARMYVLLSLCITIATYSLMTLLARDEGEHVDQPPLFGAGFALAVSAAAAFHTHYFAIQYLGLLSVMFVLIALFTGKWCALRAFAVAMFIAFIVSTPWIWFGFVPQVMNNLPPGGNDVSLMGLGEAFVQLFFHNIRFGGEYGRAAFVVGAALVMLVAAHGLLLGLLSKSLRASVLLLATAGFAVPVASWALATVLPRAGFTWHYVLPSASALAVLFAIGTRGRVASALATVPVALGAVLVGLHLANPATEDFRSAVAFALETAAPASVPAEGKAADSTTEKDPAVPYPVTRIISMEYQPKLFPQGQPWRYYAKDLAKDEVPELEPMLEREFTIADVKRLDTADRVILVSRSLPLDEHLYLELWKRFSRIEIHEFGFGVDVRVFTRGPVVSSSPEWASLGASAWSLCF